MTLFQSGETCRCPIWGHDGVQFDKQESYIFYNSQRAGGWFCLNASDDSILSGYEYNVDFKRKFSRYVRELQNNFDFENIEISLQEHAIDAKILEAINNRTLLNFSGKKEAFFRILMDGKIGKEYSYNSIFTEELTSALEFIYSSEKGIFHGFLKILSKAGSINFTVGEDNFLITGKGYEYIEALQKGGRNSKYAFVAMWFNSCMNGFYDRSVEKALIECGYVPPFRVDLKEHVNNIGDEIIAMIRQARLVIADMTCEILNPSNSDQKFISTGGVYYEAGFAQGLDVPVIWTCRHDCLKGVHFDLSQYNMLLWVHEGDEFYIYSNRNKNVGRKLTLREALKNRIKALNLDLTSV